MVGNSLPDGESAGAAPIAAGARRVVVFTTLYPNAAMPAHGVFVENRLRHLVGTGDVTARVVAPVPWFPFRAAIFGRYAKNARVPGHENRAGLAIEHPRYLVIPKIGMLLTPLTLFLAALPVLRRLQAETDFDLIDAHYFYPDGIAAAMLGRALNKPVTITARGTDINYVPRHRLPRRMILWAARQAAGIVAVSEALRRAIIALGVPPQRVRTLRNGVDLAMFKPCDRDAIRATLDLDGPTLLSVGHLIERKGNHLVIGALPQLPGYRLLLAGEGPERAALEALAIGLGVADRVQFLGPIAHSDLAAIYSAADALVLASSREGWPNVLLEAMACGTPVVATNLWGAPEIVSRPEAGVLMAERSVDGVAAGVAALFRDLPERAATRRFAQAYGWDETTRGQIRLFDEVTGTAASRPAPLVKTLRHEKVS
jgi:glycosyltransferase involved in cell wall biosynthesis